MGSSSTDAAVVKAVILSAYKDREKPRVRILGWANAGSRGGNTHGDLNAIVGKDEGGVSRGEFCGGLRRKRESAC